MPITKLFFLLAGVAGIAAYLAPLSQLTYEEKKRALALAVGAFPVVGLACYFLASAIHHEVYQAGDQVLAEDGNGLVALSLCVGLTATAILLWGASHLNGQRTYAGFLDAQHESRRAIERAKLAEQERQERMLAGRVALAQLEAQSHVLAIERDQARIQADDDRADMQQAEQAFLLAYKRYCSRVDPFNQRNESDLVDGFRQELGRRSLVRVDVKPLAGSSHPLVQRVLHDKPTVRLTP